MSDYISLVIIRLECDRPRCRPKVFRGLWNRRVQVHEKAKAWAAEHDQLIGSHLPVSQREYFGRTIWPHKIIGGREIRTIKCKLCNEYGDLASPSEYRTWIEAHEVSKRHQMAEYERGWLDELTKAVGLEA